MEYIRVSPFYDEHPDVEAAGWAAAQLFQFLLRLSGKQDKRGTVPAKQLEPAWIARRWNLCAEDVGMDPFVFIGRALEKLLSAGLVTLSRDTGDISIPGWERFYKPRALTPAERKRNQREREDMSRTVVTERDVTTLHSTTTCGDAPETEPEEQRSLALLTALPGRPVAPRKRKEATGDPMHAPLLKALLEAFLELRGRAYGMDGGADAKAVTRLLAISRDTEEHVRRWRNALGAERYPGTASIKVFAARWNELGDAPPTAEEQAIRTGELRALSERVAQRERIRHW